MGDHRVIPNGEFIICETEFQTGQPCGHGGWINREEREISRHYRSEHGNGNRQPIPYHLCAIVSEKAASQLVSPGRLAAAKKKDGPAERPCKAPRFPNWTPGGGQAAYLAARADGDTPLPVQVAADPATPADSPDLSAAVLPLAGNPGASMDPFAVSGSDAIPEVNKDDSNATQSFKVAATQPFKVATTRAVRVESNHQPHRPVQKFGDWDRDEDGGEYTNSFSDSSEPEESSDDDLDDDPSAYRISHQAIKTIPGYAAGNILKNTAARSTMETRLGPKTINVHDFSSVRHVRGLLTLAAFESIVDQENDAINPFCLTPAAWDRGIRVVNAYFRTKRTDDIKTRLREFLLLFSLVHCDFLDDHLALTKWFYEQRRECEASIEEEATAAGVEAKSSSHDTSDSCSDDEQQAYRCYACGEKLYSFRKLDVHFQVFHSEARRIVVSSAYRTWWQTKLQALELEVDNDDEKGDPMEVDLACHLCDLPFDDVDSIDRHFYVEHREERKWMLLRYFDKKFREMKEGALEDLCARWHAASDKEAK